MNPLYTSQICIDQEAAQGHILHPTIYVQKEDQPHVLVRDEQGVQRVIPKTHFIEGGEDSTLRVQGSWEEYPHASSFEIPVVHEEISVNRVTRETGHVSIHKTVEVSEEHVEAALKSTRVDIERKSVHKMLENIDPPTPHRDGDTLIVPICREVLVVEKKLLVFEELHIRQTSTHTTHTESVPVRKEVVRIEHRDLEADTHP